MSRRHFDILVIGAGPAGLAAASHAARAGLRVGVVDDQPAPGGQIWRGAEQSGTDAAALQAIRSARGAPNVTVLSETRVVAPLGADELLVEDPRTAHALRYGRLILATGARERFLPFPGWTLPGVTGVGGLQALVKGGLPIAGKRVVVAGSGPLLIAVAAHLAARDAHVLRVVEQTSATRLAAFGLQPQARPKLRQALGYGWELKRVPFRPGSWVAQATGNGRLEAVTLTNGRRSTTLSCDYLACGWGLVPNTELAAALGCAVTPSGVIVDEWQRTSQAQIFAAGEATGIGGVDLALVEGAIAGLAAADRAELAAPLQARRDAEQRWARLLEHTFALRPAVLRLATSETDVCRCEDVPYAALAAQPSWRSAKLQTRCGMGPCQGRVCGTATAALFGWSQDSIRPPVAVARVETLLSVSELQENMS